VLVLCLVVELGLVSLVFASLLLKMRLPLPLSVWKVVDVRAVFNLVYAVMLPGRILSTGICFSVRFVVLALVRLSSLLTRQLVRLAPIFKLYIGSAHADLTNTKQLGALVSFSLRAFQRPNRAF
jgi:hypothetical protein